MGKELWHLYRASTLNGVGKPGRTIHCYPADTTSNDANVTDNEDGTYLIKLRPATEGDGVIAPKSDIYDSDTLKVEDVPLGMGWRWFSRFQVTETPQSVAFADLVDENSDALPTNILNAFVIFCHAEGDSGFYITSVTDTGFTITQSGAFGADLPVYVNILVLVGEA